MSLTRPAPLTLTIVTLAALAAGAAACGDAAGGDAPAIVPGGATDAAGDGAQGLDAGPGDGAATTTSDGRAADRPPEVPLFPPFTCDAVDHGAIADDRTCSDAVRVCATGGMCPFVDLSATLAPSVLDCGAYCGELAVGFRAGCATTVVEVAVGAIAPTTHDEALACIRDQILGGRWACAPADGWARLYIGSCTVP